MRNRPAFPRVKKAMFPIAPLLVVLALADQSPDPSALIHKAIAASKDQNERKEKFTFREDEEKKGEKKRTYDNIMLEGSNYRKLILIDDRSLDAKTAKKVDEDLEKTRQERKRHSVGFHKTVSAGSLEQLERLFDNKVAGEEIVNGRKAWRMESEPKAGVGGATPSEQELLGSHLTTWFDQEDGVEVRKITTQVRNVHQVQAGNEIEVEFSKVGDSWQLASLRFHPNIKFLPGIKATQEGHWRYYDYKKFTAESTLVP